MKKYVELIELLEKLFGKGAVSRTIGTRTNVVRFPKGKQPVDPTKGELDVEGTATKNPDLVQIIENSIEDRMGDITKMNDQELLTYTANVRRLANFKEPPPLPEADIVKFGSGQEIKGKGLEELIEKQGTKNPPTTVAGDLETTGKRLEKAGEDLKEITEQKPESVIGDIMKDYMNTQKIMQSSQRFGYVRATVRQIMREDIQAGKLKLPKELQDQVMQGTGEPIDIYRKVYGEGALEQIDSLADDLGQFRTEEEAAKFARSKYTFEPKAEPVDESKTYEELEEMFKKGPDEPEGKADGGIIGYANGGRIGYAEGTKPGFTPQSRPSLVEDFYKSSFYDPKAMGTAALVPVTLPTGEEFTFSGGAPASQFQEYLKSLSYSTNRGDGGGYNVIAPTPTVPAPTIPTPVTQPLTPYTPNVQAAEELKAKFNQYLSSPSSTPTTEGIENLYNQFKKNLTETPPPPMIQTSTPPILSIPTPVPIMEDNDYANLNPAKQIPYKDNPIYENFLQSPFYDPRAIGGAAMTEVQLPTGEFFSLPNTAVADQFRQYLSSTPAGGAPVQSNSQSFSLPNIYQTGGRVGYSKGKKVKSQIDKLIEQLNKKTKGKKSMESVDPKTGEVTTPKRPIRKAEEPTGMTTMDPEPEIVDEKSISKVQQKTKVKKYDDDIIKAADEIYPSYDDPKIAADQIVDSYAQMKFGLEDQYGLSNKQRMDLYTQAYDYVMDYNRGALKKTTGESINISDPKTAEAFTNFARENDPEGFKKIQKIVDDINNKNALDEFDITGREPNANGGIAGLL